MADCQTAENKSMVIVIYGRRWQTVRRKQQQDMANSKGGQTLIFLSFSSLLGVSCALLYHDSLSPSFSLFVFCLILFVCCLLFYSFHSLNCVVFFFEATLFSVGSIPCASPLVRFSLFVSRALPDDLKSVYASFSPFFFLSYFVVLFVSLLLLCQDLHFI